MELPLNNSAATVVDLFCGAGGLSCGFINAGFEVLHAIDHWAPAVETYRRNNGTHVSCREIDATMSLPRSTVIAGGPPCQGFSSAGHRRNDDDRNSLVLEFAKIIAAKRPDAFVFENVEGFLTGADGTFVLELLNTVVDAGYWVHIRKVNAANFGVPQHRKRVIAIGGRGWAPDFPTATHRAFGAPGAELANERHFPFCPSIGEALAELPPAAIRDCNAGDTCHEFVPLDGDDAARAKLLKQGQCMRDLPPELWHESYERRANRRVKDGTPTERRGGAPAGLRRLRADEPSKAITGGALRDFLHPTDDRMLTVRECAVLQTFGPNYQFAGTQAERIQQIGNAVPPRMAEAIASCLMNGLGSCSPTDDCDGRLLSFIPTLSNGMSPILQRVVDRVQRRFSRETTVLVQKQLWD